MAVEILEAAATRWTCDRGAVRGRAGRVPGRCHLLGIRSNTTVTPRALDAAPDLQAIGCFCIGTNQVDLGAAAERGIGVFNAPYSNTRSVVELVIGEIIALARRLPEKTQRMHDGVWDKSARGSHEVRGRTLGIVGYGNIGTQLSNVAEALGMRVVFYDKADRPAHGNARRSGRSRSCSRSPTWSASTSTDGPATPDSSAPPSSRDEAAVALHQRIPRHGRRRPVAARTHAVRAHRRRGPRCLPRRAEGPGRSLPIRPARPRQRHPDAARRRLHAGGAGGDRLVRRREARPLRPRGEYGALGRPAARPPSPAETAGHRRASCTATSPVCWPTSTPPSPPAAAT